MRKGPRFAVIFFMLPVYLVANVLHRRLEGVSSDRGAAMVEYAVLVTLIAVLAIGALKFFGQTVSEEFSHIDCQVTDAAANNPAC